MRLVFVFLSILILFIFILGGCANQNSQREKLEVENSNNHQEEKISGVDISHTKFELASLQYDKKSLHAVDYSIDNGEKFIYRKHYTDSIIKVIHINQDSMMEEINVLNIVKKNGRFMRSSLASYNGQVQLIAFELNKSQQLTDVYIYSFEGDHFELKTKIKYNNSRGYPGIDFVNFLSPDSLVMFNFRNSIKYTVSKNNPVGINKQVFSYSQVGDGKEYEREWLPNDTLKVFQDGTSIISIPNEQIDIDNTGSNYFIENNQRIFLLGEQGSDIVFYQLIPGENIGNAKEILRVKNTWCFDITLIDNGVTWVDKKTVHIVKWE